MAVLGKSVILGAVVAAAVLLVCPPCFVASKGRLPEAEASIETAAVASRQPAGSEATEATMKLQDEIESNSAFRVGSAALSVLAALLVALAPAADAKAARTGSRIGSSAPSRQ